MKENWSNTTSYKRFLHYVNIICINITKRDPNNLSIFFFSLGMCFKDNLFFCVENAMTVALPFVWTVLGSGLSVCQELGCSSLPGFCKWLYSSSRWLLEKPKELCCYRGGNGCCLWYTHSTDWLNLGAPGLLEFTWPHDLSSGLLSLNP